MVDDVLEPALELAQDYLERAAAVVFSMGFADAQNRGHPMVQRGEDLLVNQFVGFMKNMAALGMADYHVSDAVSVEHRGRHLAGERALVLEVHVLRAQQNRRARQRLRYG